MKEKLQHHSPEQHRSQERETSQERTKAEKLREKATKAEHTPKDNIESIQRSIEATAISGKEYSIGEKEKATPHTPLFVTKRLKNDAYKKLIKKTQSHLSKPERNFSKFIHRPAIERVSEAASKTVARPSGILFGGLAAFLASLFLLIISKRAGFTYNYLFFFIVFVGGYFSGLLIEAVYRLVRKPPRH